MTSVDANEPKRGSDDIVAAEYVLGVTEPAERSATARRVDADAAFARLVDEWEVRLSPLAAAYQPVEPSASVKAAIDRRLFSAAVASRSPARGGLWSSLAFWRGLAAAAVAAFVLYLAMPFLYPPAVLPQNRLVASLAADGSDVRYLVVYDGTHGDVALSHVSGERAGGHDFELWMIEGKNKPVSMGVIPVGAATHIAIKPDAQKKLDAGAVLAVTLEPKGGSPSGQPTGPVVAAGDLKSI
jgi:anti-sigma-K factor RskA